MPVHVVVLVLSRLAVPAPSHPDGKPGIEALQRFDWPSAIPHLTQVVRNQAREHVVALERRCGRNCDEQRNLPKAIRGGETALRETWEAPRL